MMQSGSLPTGERSPGNPEQKSLITLLFEKELAIPAGFVDKRALFDWLSRPHVLLSRAPCADPVIPNPSNRAG
jgi:hypothetical protein